LTLEIGQFKAPEGDMMTRVRQVVAAWSHHAARMRFVTMRFVTLMVIAACWVALAPSTPARAGPAEDAYVAGYVSAVLERQMDVKGGRVTVKDGVVTVEVAGLSAGDRERVVATLSTVPGVSRVLVSGRGRGPPATHPREGRRRTSFAQPASRGSRDSPGWAGRTCRAETGRLS
jgi:hypothetical protein